MPLVFIPPLLRELTQGESQVRISGSDLREVIEALDDAFPGFSNRLCVAGQLRPEIQVAVNQTMGIRNLRQVVAADDEVHFLPAIGGG